MIIAGNFKANHTHSSTLAYCQALEKKLQAEKTRQSVYVFPSMGGLIYDDFSFFSLGVQNAYPVNSGAFTGEIGLLHLQGLGIKNVMVGHSERRDILGESNALCQRKFDFFANAGMRIFFCIGERLEIRQLGKVIEFLQSQLKGIDLSYSQLIVAYEPIWAIGTGVSASLEEIEETHQILKSLGVKTLLYGGSVNPQNAKEIMGLSGVDGVLVGGASLKVEDFYQIIKQGDLLC